jgi:hypothetical protein
MTPRLFETRAARKAFLIDATRQLRAEIRAGGDWIFSALTGAVGVVRRIVLRVATHEQRQA